MQTKGVVAKHPWLDRLGRVTGFDPISSERAFRESRLLLGQAVKQVVQQLQLHPPEILEITDDQLGKMQGGKRKQQERNPTKSSSMNGADLPPSYDTLLNPPQVDLPTIPSNFPDLDGMDRVALNELLNSDVVFLEYCNTLPVTSQLQQLVSDKYQELAKLANENLSRQSELQELHKSIQSAHDRLKMVVEEFQILEKQQDALHGKPDPHKIKLELAKAKKEAFDESETLAEEWLEQGEQCATTMDQFCRDFLEKRKIHHMRAAKVQILRHQQQ